MSMTEDQGATVTVGSALAEALARAGVKIAFTVPGESVLGLLEGLAANRIRVVAARHEGAAAFMAEAVAQLTGRPAVCVAARGPGRGQPGHRPACRPGRLRAASSPSSARSGATCAAARRSRRWTLVARLRAARQVGRRGCAIRPTPAPMLERAIATATRGRPGPVLLAVPADILDAGVRRRARPARGAPCRAPRRAGPDPRPQGPAPARRRSTAADPAPAPASCGPAARTPWSASPRRCASRSWPRGAGPMSSPTTTRSTSA